MASESLYGLSGMSNSPMFINWTPIGLDLTPYRQNQQMMMQMTEGLAAENAARRQKLEELDIPDFKGLAPSVARASDMVASAKEGAIKRFASLNNPNAAAHDEEFMGHMGRYRRGNSPELRRLLEQEKETHDGVVAWAKESPDNPSVIPYVNGRFVTDDRNGRMLSVGQALETQLRDPSAPFSVANPESQQIDQANWTLESPQGFKDKLFADFSKAASSEFSSTAPRDEETLKEMMKVGGAGGVAAGIVYNGRYGGNANQINATTKSYLETLGDRGKSAIMQAYMQSPEGQRRMNLEKSKRTEGGNTGFISKDGSIDQEELFNATFGDDGSGSSYAVRFVQGEAARALSVKNIVDPKLLKFGLGSGGGGGADENGLWNTFAFRAMNGPMAYESLNGEGTTPMTGWREATFIADSGTGEAGAYKSKIVVDDMAPGTYSYITRKLLGETVSPGQDVSEKNLMASDVLGSSTDMVFPDGTVMKTSDGDFKVTKIYRDVADLPVDIRSINAPLLTGKGFNETESYVLMEIEIDNEGRNQDLVGQVTSLPNSEIPSRGNGIAQTKAVPITSQEYRQRYSQYVTHAQDSWSFDAGTEPVRVKVWTKVGPGLMTDNDPAMKTNPKFQSALRDPARQEAASRAKAEAGAPAIINGVMRSVE